MENPNNNNISDTDKKIKEVSEKIETFVKKNKLQLIIGWVVLFIVIVAMANSWEKYKKEDLQSKITEIWFETNKKENLFLLEGSTKIVKAGEMWKVKEYYETIDWQPVVRIRDWKCDECKKPVTQEEEIGRFNVEEAKIEVQKVAQNFLQHMKDADYNSFQQYLSNDWLENTTLAKFRNLNKRFEFKLNAFTIEDCKANLEQTNYMEFVCKTSVELSHMDIGSWKEVIDLKVIYNKDRKNWGVRFPFFYELTELQGMWKNYDAQKVDATINTSLSILDGRMAYIMKSIEKDNVALTNFKTNQMFDYLLVETFVTKSVKNSETGQEEDKYEKVWEKKVNVKKGKWDEYTKYNNENLTKFSPTKKEWVNEIWAYIPIMKPKNDFFKEGEKFKNFYMRVTPWIDTVNPYLKFPTLEFFYDSDKRMILDKEYQLAY